MTTELTIGAINPGYGGLPIGVAAALGGASLAWHAHPGQTPDCPARTIMRYHHPHAGAHDQRMGLLYSGTVPLQAAHAVASGMSRVYQP